MAVSGRKDLQKVLNTGRLTNGLALSLKFIGSGGSVDLRCCCNAITFCFSFSSLIASKSIEVSVEHEFWSSFSKENLLSFGT